MIEDFSNPPNLDKQWAFISLPSQEQNIGRLFLQTSRVYIYESCAPSFAFAFDTYPTLLSVSKARRSYDPWSFGSRIELHRCLYPSPTQLVPPRRSSERVSHTTISAFVLAVCLTSQNRRVVDLHTNQKKGWYSPQALLYQPCVHNSAQMFAFTGKPPGPPKLASNTNNLLMHHFISNSHHF